jgi:site-specific recombinase XerD
VVFGDLHCNKVAAGGGAGYTGYTMASLYKRNNSPYWWIKYKDAAGKTRQHTTGLRHSVPDQTKKANLLVREKHLLELKREKGSEHGGWDAWVEKFLESDYETQPKTLHRYKTCWRNLYAYLKEKGILAPHQLTFDDCVGYMDWRQAGQPHLGIYKCAHNTARLDLKILHLICERAIRRGLILANPCRKLGIKRHKSREKPELTDEDISLIRKKLAELKMPQWMRTSFEIAIHQGVRLSETSFPLSRIDWKQGNIEFHAKRDVRYSVAIHPKLLPLLKKMKKEKGTLTCELPKMASKEWWRFFKKIGLHQKGVCFHCTRVTVITRLIRSGWSEANVMNVVHHASTEVHRIYQRLKVEDSRSVLASLQV